MVLPVEVLVVINWNTAEMGQVSGLRAVLLSHDLAGLRRAWLLGDLGWREGREGIGGRVEVDILSLLARCRWCRIAE